MEEQQVTFTASVTGTQPIGYSWDFGGGAEPATSSDESPVVVLGAAGEYSCWLTVTNSAGEASFPFSLTVTPYNEQPVALLYISPSSGKVPLEVSLDSRGSYDPDGTIANFQFDLDGDGTFETDNGGYGFVQHTYEAEGSLILAVRVTDNEGAAATSTKQITLLPNTGDNLPPVAALTASTLEGDAPLLVSFDASASFDPDGTIVGYDWNFDGGLWDLEGVGPVQEHTYTVPYPTTTATVKVWDSEGASTEKSVLLSVKGFHLSFVAQTSGIEAKDVSLYDVGGLPAIAYYDHTNFALKYVRALNERGTSWTNSSILDSGENIAGDLSLAMIGGNPAVAYYDEPNGDLKYAAAQNSTGTIWNEPVVVDSDLDSGRKCVLLQLANGNPGIFYYKADASSGSLMFVAAESPDGSFWGTPVVVDDQGKPGYSGIAGVILADGIISVAYVDFASKELRFAKSFDAACTEWVLIGPIANDSRTVVAGLWNDRLFCAYSSFQGQDLFFLYSNDGSGESWIMPQKLDDANVNKGPCIIASADRILLPYQRGPIGGEYNPVGVVYFASPSGLPLQWSELVQISPASVLEIKASLIDNSPAITYGMTGGIYYCSYY
ncbi:MAG: PKD domain-containing protein [bacterium]|jgi:PKD repeat protein